MLDLKPKILVDFRAFVIAETLRSRSAPCSCAAVRFRTESSFPSVLGCGTKAWAAILFQSNPKFKEVGPVFLGHLAEAPG